MSRLFRLLPLIVILVLLGVIPVQAQESSEGTFPITIEHVYGSTTITQAPQRVVAIGYIEHDLLLAVGVTPVAVRYWYGDEANTIQPWAQDRVEGEAPVVLNMLYGNLNYEAILALQPDLISAVTSGITQEEYDLLSQIAPTIAQSGDYINFGMPWQEATQMVGDAVGKSAEAAAAVAEVEALFAQARAEHPQFEGKTVAVSYFNAGTYGFYTSQDIRGRFFTELGFVIPEEMDEIAGDLFYADINAERIDLLDRDLIAILNLQFIEGGREALEAEPLFSQLTAAQEGRVIYFDEQAENALGYSSPLSLPYALDAALPQLEALFGGPSDASPCEPGFRLFTHELLWSETPDGVCIPEDPQRIAYAWSFHVPALLRAGVPLIGVGDRAYLTYLFPEWQAAFEAITDIGEPPNLEVTLSLNPDVIIEPDWAADDNYDQVSAIAPTVVFQFGGTHQWKELARMYFDIAGRLDAYDELMAEYEARAAELGELIGNPQDIEISLVAVWGPSRVYTNYSPGGMIVEDVGFSRPAAQVLQQTPEEVIAAGGYPFFLPLPLEEIQKAEGDFIIAFGDFDTEEGAALRRELEEHPLWQTLEAVQAGNVYFTTVNWAGGDIAGAHAILDDIARAFGVFDQLSPNPYTTVPETEATETP